MPNQEIFCTVNSCYYYSEADKCHASKIMVRNNPETLRNTAMEIGSIGGEASASNQTLCETFVLREKGPKPGISRFG